jgi:hypothetical protein
MNTCVEVSPAEAAKAKLTPNWQPLSKLKLSPTSGIEGFRELVEAGVADVQFDRKAKAGERIQYRLRITGSEGLSPRCQRRRAKKAA